MDNLKRSFTTSHELVNSSRNINKEAIEKSDLESIASYLNDPFSSGLWHLCGEWNSNSEFSMSIWNEILKEIGDKDFIEIKSGKRSRKLKVDENWKKEIKDIVCNSVSFMFTIFSYLASDDTATDENTESYSSVHEVIQLILDLIELDEVKENNMAAFEYFKKEIWFKEFNPFIYSNHLFRLKTGAVICSSRPQNEEDILLISWSGKPLKNLNEFLQILGKINKSSLMPIFSPEEEVFAPYFDLLEISYSYIVKQEHLKPLFDKSIKQFKEQNFSDCVSAIGLIAEDLLTQVYETFFRTQLNKGLTLGQLTDEITIKVNSLFDKKIETPPNFSGLYDEIKYSLESEDSKDIAALENIRSLLTMTIANNKYFSKKVDDLGKPKSKISIFTDRVLFSINELIRFRNASSHKSRIPIGPYEATRSIYSLMVFLMWWDNEKRNIDWEKSAEDIIRETVSRNSNK